MKKLSLLLLVVLLFNTVFGFDCLAAYNPTKAQTYAYNYWQAYNSAFPDFSSDGDCANFVSQCLNAGGFAMTDEWKTYKVLFIFKKATPSWCNAYQLGEYIGGHFAKTKRVYTSLTSLSTYNSAVSVGDPIRYYFGYKAKPTYHMAITTQSCWLYGTQITQHTTDRKDCSYKYNYILNPDQQKLTSCVIYQM